MDRRNFFKIVSTVSASLAASGCGKKRDELIPLLVPEHEIVPGEEQWRAAVCGECAAGCGVIVRVMEGERTIERNGNKFRERIASIKKIEGNPLDPVSGGRLCARGQAALQSLYNPDRVRGPLHRTADRGKASFADLSWAEAIDSVAEKLTKARAANAGGIMFLTGPQASARTLTIQRFLESIGAPPPLTCSLASFAVERKAADSVFGWKGVPRYDLGNARYVLGVGADFVGGWASPVYYGRQYGHFRQGRAGVRGKLVQAESRMSLTAENADEWLPLRPGSEPHFLVALARLILDEKLERKQGALPPEVQESIAGSNLADLIRVTGLEENHLRRIARELGESEAPLVIAGASIVHSNSVESVIAGHYLNVLLGNVGQPGGLFPPHAATATGPQSGDVAEALKHAKVLLLDSDNPAYALPAASGVTSALTALEAIVSFGPFIDDSAAYADLILPDHQTLESEAAVAPAVAASPVDINVSAPIIRPLYNTRQIEQTLSDIAKKMNVTFEAVGAKSMVEPLLPPGETWDDVTRRGGLWGNGENAAAPPSLKPVGGKVEWSSAVFDGAAEQFPLQFQPYPSLQYHDGGGANLPWMQKLPDPVSSAMWDLPVEVDPQTAARLNVATGDAVRVESSHGSLDAAVYVHPAAIPGVVSMAIGEGHTHYGRYASGRGANPLSILAPIRENSTNVLALGATRVRLTSRNRKSAELIQFSPNDREQGPWGYR
jgi:anaerobic selenocysteine-containing dehydrogenase